MSMHQWLDDGAPVTYTLAPSGHTDREGDLAALHGAHRIDLARFDTRPMQQGPRVDNLELDNEARINRRLCLAVNERPGDIFPPTCKRSNDHEPPHRAAHGDEWSDHA